MSEWLEAYMAILTERERQVVVLLGRGGCGRGGCGRGGAGREGRRGGGGGARFD